MKRAALPAAIVLTLGLGAGASQAAKPKQLATQAEIELFRFLPDDASFTGDVHSRKNKCERRREVTIRNTEPLPGESEVVGVVETDRTGDFEVIFDDELLTQGPYIAEVARKRVGKGGKKLRCKAATSPPFELDLI